MLSPKKATVIATGVAMLMALGTSSAMANRNDNDHPDHKVTICHATSSETNPYVRIHVDEHSAEANGHANHERDIIQRDDNDNFSCPGPTTPPPGDDDDDDDTPPPAAGNCSAESTSGDSTSDQRGLVNVGNVDVNLGNTAANALCQSDIANNLTAAVLGSATGGSGGGDAAANSGCSATSTSGDSTSDQRGLVNVGNIGVNGGNLASNALCQSSILNNLTAAVLGDAVGGDSGDAAGAEGCSAESTSGDSDSDGSGLVNVGNVSVDAGNAAANLLCQSDVLNNATVAVLGSASGLGGGIIGGGGLLGGGLGDVLSIIVDANASLLASVGVIF